MRRAIALGLIAFSFISCKKKLTESELQSEDFPSRVDAEEFRDVFARVVGGRFKEEQLNQLVYFPDAAMFSAGAERDAGAFFKRLDTLYRALEPDQLFAVGKKTAFSKNAPDWQETLKKTPITFVIVPGVFGEFIRTRSMEEILERTQSSSAKTFAKAYAASSDGAAKSDSHFSLDDFKDVEKPLTELMVTASIDAADGSPLVQLVTFQTPLMALETLGRNDDVAKNYVRRLGKFFKINGTPENVVFLGYSRGSAVGLEMVNQARKEAWFKKVRAFVGLGGVIYGSDLADQIHVPGSKAQRQLNAFEELIGTLKPLDDVPILKRPGVVAANTAAWARFGKEMVVIDPGFAKATLANSKGSDIGSMLGLVKDIWLKLNLNDFFTDYSVNIHRFLRLGKSILDAVNELTTSARLEWWRQHTVPTDLSYYAIVATMADPDTAKMGAANARSVVSYGVDTADYRTLLSGYRDFAKTTGLALNDSQVAVHKSMFWPELHARINPAQEPMNIKFLGVLGTHHWGLALRVVSEMKDGEINPFPREDLLKAIATKIAWDIERQTIAQ